MHIIRCAITAAYMCARDRMTTPFVTAIHITLVDCNQLHHVDIYIYTVAQDLSILCDPKDMAKGKTSGQNPNAGWFNRFVQTGKSDHETKSNECFGGLCDHCIAAVCISIV